MKKQFLLLILLALMQAEGLFSQVFESVNLKLSNSNSITYTQLKPKGELKGLLVFLPGYAGGAEEVFRDSDLPKQAHNQGIMTISLSYGQKLYLDKDTQNLLNEVISSVLEKNQISKNKVVLGGFSAGGTLALRYAEKAIEQNNQPIQPKAVFAIDSPLDLQAFYEYCIREIATDCPHSKMGVQEAQFIMPVLAQAMGGKPDEVPERYQEESAYARQAKDGGNAHFLKNTPTRLYSEPDFEWQSRERCRDVLGMNIIDLAGIANQLRILGNPKVELITTVNKGYRPNGMRHPHSYSIVDSLDCVNWLVKNLAD